MSENLILSPLLLLFFVSRRTSPNLGLSNCIISSFNKAFNAYVLLVAKTLRVVENNPIAPPFGFKNNCSPALTRKGSSNRVNSQVIVVTTGCFEVLFHPLTSSNCNMRSLVHPTSPPWPTKETAKAPCSTSLNRA
ncbi:MAG: Uncharacterised protein [Flavobacteriales bacterium UBA4585]|nr:MAG: Uncharacterised protein [Flavobacteriales bacterium UBA4585]